MFITIKNRKCLIFVMGLMFLVDITATARASCDIQDVCKLVEDKKTAMKNESIEIPPNIDDTSKTIIEMECGIYEEMHDASVCPIDQVIDLCWKKETADVAEQCKE